MKTACPLLVSQQEAAFQLGVPVDDVQRLVHEGELVAVCIRGHPLIVYESLVALTRRAARVDLEA